MRCLERDKIAIWYCVLKSKTPVTDSNGYITGEYNLVYSRPQLLRASLGAGSGQGSFVNYGTNQVYDRTIETDDKSYILPEGTILFIGKEITYDDSGVPLGNWVVMRAIESINSVTYGLERIR